MSIPKQNVRSKALPGKDGKPRDTSAKGFKQRTSGIGSGPRRVAHEMVREAAEAPEPEVQEEQAERMPVYRADGFARAVDLTSAAEARQRLAPMAEGPDTPGEWHDQVIARDVGCRVTGLVPRAEELVLFDVHHGIPKSLLRRRGLHGWVWDVRIGMYLVDPVHDWFDDGTPRFLPGNALPPGVWEAAAEMDAYLGGGTSWATNYLRERYPVVDAGRLEEIKAEGLAQARALGIRGAR